MFEKRRRSVRVALTGSCRCESALLIQYVHIQDISKDGLFIRTHSPLEIGQQIKVRWGFPEKSEEHEAQTIVVWKRESSMNVGEQPGMGLKFVSLDTSTHRAILDYIKDMSVKT